MKMNGYAATSSITLNKIFSLTQEQQTETCVSEKILGCAIALFTDNFTHLHYNAMQCGHGAISGSFVIFARNCLAFVFSFIVMQM